MKRLSHIPFRFISRTVMGVILVSVVGLVSWSLWKVFFEPVEGTVFVTNERVDLLQEKLVQEVETYAKNPDLPGFPASLFPTGDIENLK